MNETHLLAMLRLQLNVMHPDVEECYVEGYEAAIRGFDEQENPFLSGTRENNHWADGWWAGFYGEKPALALKQSSQSNASAILLPANDHAFAEGIGNFLVKVLEITSVIGVAALVGYQVLDLVA